MKSVNCENCGKVVLVKRYRLKMSKLHFCNRDCYTEYQRKSNHNENAGKTYFKDGVRMIDFNCEVCGEGHTQKFSNYNRSVHHYCSTVCATAGKVKEKRITNMELLKEEIYCACGCGQELKRYVKRNTPGLVLRERKYIVGHTGNGNNSGHFIKGIIAWNKGVTVSEEMRQRLSMIAKERLKDGMSMETRIKMACSRRNIPIEEFNGFTTEGNPRIDREEVKKHSKWRNEIFERDKYVCQSCGDKSCQGHTVILNAHHIKSWYDFSELRRELFNGVTLCSKCHYYVHSKKYQNELGDKFVAKTESIAV